MARPGRGRRTVSTVYQIRDSRAAPLVIDALGLVGHVPRAEMVDVVVPGSAFLPGEIRTRRRGAGKALVRVSPWATMGPCPPPCPTREACTRRPPSSFPTGKQLAVLPRLRPGWAGGQHGGLPRRADLEPCDVDRVDRGPARPRPRAAGAAARSRDADRRRVRAPRPARQSRGGPAATRRTRCRSPRSARPETAPHQGDPRVPAAARGGEEAAGLAQAGPAAPQPPGLTAGRPMDLCDARATDEFVPPARSAPV